MLVCCCPELVREIGEPVAALSQDPKSKTYRILFWFGGKQYHKSLKTTDQREAEAKKGSIEEMLLGMERGWIQVPPPDRFWPSLFSGGKLDAKPSVPDVLTLDRLFARYEQEMPPGTMEANSLGTF